MHEIKDMLSTLVASTDAWGTPAGSAASTPFTSAANTPYTSATNTPLGTPAVSPTSTPKASPKLLPVTEKPQKHVQAMVLEVHAKMEAADMEQAQKVNIPRGVFADPVTDLIAPGYSSMVKTPMDFGTMRRRIDSGHYSTLDSYSADLKLVCDNCKLYNKQGWFVEHARFIWKKGQSLLRSKNRALDKLLSNPPRAPSSMALPPSSSGVSRKKKRKKKAQVKSGKKVLRKRWLSG